MFADLDPAMLHGRWHATRRTGRRLRTPVKLDSFWSMQWADDGDLVQARARTRRLHTSGGPPTRCGPVV